MSVRLDLLFVRRGTCRAIAAQPMVGRNSFGLPADQSFTTSLRSLCWHVSGGSSQRFMARMLLVVGLSAVK